jgi:hypothetical protein
VSGRIGGSLRNRSKVGPRRTDIAEGGHGVDIGIPPVRPPPALIAGGGALARALRERTRQINSVVVPLGLAAALMLPQSAPVHAQAKSFSFVEYGDSRPMMYLPYTQANADIIHASLVNIFALILGGGHGRGG